MSDSGDTVAARPAGVDAQRGGLGAWVRLDPAKLAKFLFALLLLPACAGFARAFHECFWGLDTQLRVATLGWPELWRWLAFGVGLYLVIGILVWRPVILYVFAHEMTHALATWCCLGRVSNFRAAVSGGAVTVSKSNTLIRLAPYILPLYAVLVAGVYVGFELYGKPLKNPQVLAASLGFTLAFHFGFTLWSLHRGQSDLKQDGWFFSLVVVFLGNLLLLAAFLGLALSGKSAGAWEALSYVADEGWRKSLQVFGGLVRVVEQGFRG